MSVLKNKTKKNFRKIKKAKHLTYKKFKKLRKHKKKRFRITYKHGGKKGFNSTIKLHRNAEQLNKIINRVRRKILKKMGRKIGGGKHCTIKEWFDALNFHTNKNFKLDIDIEWWAKKNNFDLNKTMEEVLNEFSLSSEIITIPQVNQESQVNNEPVVIEESKETNWYIAEVDSTDRVQWKKGDIFLKNEMIDDTMKGTIFKIGLVPISYFKQENNIWKAEYNRIYEPDIPDEELSFEENDTFIKIGDSKYGEWMKGFIVQQACIEERDVVYSVKKNEFKSLNLQILQDAQADVIGILQKAESAPEQQESSTKETVADNVSVDTEEKIIISLFDKLFKHESPFKKLKDLKDLNSNIKEGKIKSNDKFYLTAANKYDLQSYIISDKLTTNTLIKDEDFSNPMKNGILIRSLDTNIKLFVCWSFYFASLLLENNHDITVESVIIFKVFFESLYKKWHKLGGETYEKIIWLHIFVEKGIISFSSFQEKSTQLSKIFKSYGNVTEPFKKNKGDFNTDWMTHSKQQELINIKLGEFMKHAHSGHMNGVDVQLDDILRKGSDGMVEKYKKRTHVDEIWGPPNPLINIVKKINEAMKTVSQKFKKKTYSNDEDSSDSDDIDELEDIDSEDTSDDDENDSSDDDDFKIIKEEDLNKVDENRHRSIVDSVIRVTSGTYPQNRDLELQNVKNFKENDGEEQEEEDDEEEEDEDEDEYDEEPQLENTATITYGDPSKYELVSIFIEDTYYKGIQDKDDSQLVYILKKDGATVNSKNITPWDDPVEEAGDVIFTKTVKVKSFKKFPIKRGEIIPEKFDFWYNKNKQSIGTGNYDGWRTGTADIGKQFYPVTILGDSVSSTSINIGSRPITTPSGQPELLTTPQKVDKNFV